MSYACVRVRVDLLYLLFFFTASYATCPQTFYHLGDPTSLGLRNTLLNS